MKDLFYDKATMQKLIAENWSVQIMWFPFNIITAWEALEAFFEKEIDVGEWNPMEDEVWVRVVNKINKVGPVLSTEKYTEMDRASWYQMKGFQLVDGFVTSFPPFAPSFLRSQVIHFGFQQIFLYRPWVADTFRS